MRKIVCILFLMMAFQTYAQQIAKAKDVQLVVTAGTVINASGGLTFAGTTNFKNDGTVNILPAAIKQNWIDSTAAGVLDNAGTGLVHFNGDSVHTFFGNTKFYNLRINSDSSMNLLTNIEISNQLSLDKGLINTNANTVLVSNPSLTAIQSTGNFAGSWINGKLSRVENITGSDYFFPIGKLIGADSFYAPIKLEKFNTSTATHTAVYFRSSPTDRNNFLNPPIDHISDIEYWEVQSSNFALSNDDDAKLSLSWRGGSAVSITPATRDSLLVAQYTSGPQWQATGDIVGTLSLVAGSTNFGFVKQRFFVGNFNTAEKQFTLASRSPFNILPFKLIRFEANPLALEVHLNWQMEFDQDLQNYFIEKSTDGINFQLLTTIPSLQRNQNNYVTTDFAPVKGWNYYRLKMKDRTGNTFNGGIRKVWFGSKMSEPQIFPNPAQHTLFVTIPAYNGKSSIRLMDVHGKQIAQYQPAGNTLAIAIQQLGSGTYLLQLTQGEQKQIVRFIKN